MNEIFKRRDDERLEPIHTIAARWDRRVLTLQLPDPTYLLRVPRVVLAFLDFSSRDIIPETHATRAPHRGPYRRRP